MPSAEARTYHGARATRAPGGVIGADTAVAPAITLTAGLPPLPLIALTLLGLFLPGWALAILLLRAPAFDGLDRWLCAPALSVAVLALVPLWASTIALPLGPPAAWALLLAAVAVVSREAALVLRSHRPVPSVRDLAHHARLPVAFLFVFLGGLVPRLWSTRDVLPTLGADVYHHTLIALLIVERGGLPATYLPYASIQSFAYHFGFHALVAWLHWWTAADLATLVGIAGHLLNAAVALSVAFFVRRVLRDDLVALLACWLVAFLCPFPAYFVNWGRFTQTAGLVLLPVAAALVLDTWRPSLFVPRPAHHKGTPGAGALRAGLWAGAALAAVGLFLAHYRMAAVLAALLAVWWLLAPWLACRRPRTPLRETAAHLGRAWSAAALRGVALGLLSVVLLSPWLRRLQSGLSLGLGERPGDYGAGYYALERLGQAPTLAGNWLIAPLAVAGLALAFRWRAAPLLLIAAWGALQLALANPHWWRWPVPFAGRVDLVTVAATLVFPLAVLAAVALAALLRADARGGPRLATWTGAVLLVGGTLLGAWQLSTLVTPHNALVAAADLQGAAWLRDNTPADTRVAAATVVFDWAPDYVVGIDAGYWLPLLAGRDTTVLPMLYPAERGTDPGAAVEMVVLARALHGQPSSPATAALLRAYGVSYLYHGGRAEGPPLAPLLMNPAFHIVYARDGVHILAVQPP